MKDLEYEELISQPYKDCSFSSGLVRGHPYDTLYLKLLRDGEETIILLRPDEAAALAWCLTGALWTVTYTELVENKLWTAKKRNSPGLKR